MRRLTNLFKRNKPRHSESSTTSGVSKEEHMDWAAMTEEQQGYYSALTMSKNLHGAGLTFRCKASNPLNIFTLSLSGTAQYQFKANKQYKIRLQFDNMVVLYSYLHAYKSKHATIIDISDKFFENISDSKNLTIDFVGESGIKITTKFSLKGASAAIDSVITRCNSERTQLSSWLSNTAHHAAVAPY